MQKLGDGVLLSASDLMVFTGCAHATTLDLRKLRGEPLEPASDDPEARLLQAKGDAHERAYLMALVAEGRAVVEIPANLPQEAAIGASLAALREGPDVIFQATLGRGLWAGRADFLERVEWPSALGAFSYEIVDTKLKRRPDPRHVLQLVLYSDLMADSQGNAPEAAHLVLGTGERVSLLLADYAAYARGVRRRLERFVADPPTTRPEPCAACALCRWREHCAAEWRATDSLARVAGITRDQRRKLEAAGVTTMRALGEREARVPRLAQETLEKLRAQARLQAARDAGGHPAVELRPIEPGKGFGRLPQPDAGDLFYDIEGDPHVEGGLEYLHGVWARDLGFRAFWAHDEDEEARALQAVLDLFGARLAAHPDAHVYHYAAYEVTALRRLAAKHGRGEAFLDRMLREERFVDLYTVVRGAVFASEPGYSLKDLEVFYMEARAGEVTTAGGSVVAYEAWRETRQAAILAEIEDYNRIDCVSTEGMRDWLLSLRPGKLPWPELGQDGEAAAAAEEAEVVALRGRLETCLAPEKAKLLFDLARFHPRERKPACWSVFDRIGRESEELAEDLDCVAMLCATAPAEQAGKTLRRPYRFPEQGTKLRRGARANAAPRGCRGLAHEDGTTQISVREAWADPRGVPLHFRRGLPGSSSYPGIRSAGPSTRAGRHEEANTRASSATLNDLSAGRF